ncbi:unnamed protein product [Allacma fusca]|uniref:KAP NTPase domain-containing protein n=1 Tax=Allacma fusca TaxID=39272 RepID=A0A8J2LI50_9HEXA|nr:unnamed protein product [Allacma fusca]
MHLVTTSPATMDSFAYGYNSIMANINEDNLIGVRLLIESGQVGVDDRDESGATALMTTCHRGKLNVVRILLDKGAEVNAEDSDSWTPLHYAAKEGHHTIVQYLINHGADITHKDDGGWTPLIWACYKGRRETARILIDKGANVNAAGYYNVSCLGWAAGRNHLDIVKDLIKANADVNAHDRYGTTPLIWAARKGNLQVVKTLLAAKADVDAVGMNSWRALIVATEGNHRDVVKALLEQKPNLDAQDKDGCSALTYACKAGSHEIASELVNAGAAINAVDRFGNSNLLHATKAGQRNVIQLLLDNHADVNIQGRDSKTALYCAIEKFQMNVIPILLAANPNLEAQTKDGDTALMKAVRNRCPEIISLLLDRKAKVSTSDKSGDNSLHIAMRARSNDIVELLLRNPINSQLLYRANAVGETPYGIDRTSAKPVITQLFGSHGTNSQEDFENMGYNAYCSTLANMLSDPTLQMPLTVGLFSKWGSGKSFLLLKLKQELACFSHTWRNPLFSWSPLLLALVTCVGALVATIAGLATYSYTWGGYAGGICLLFILTILFVIWFYAQHATRPDACAQKLSHFVGGTVDSLKLILQVLLCRPAGRQSNDSNQTHPINFYFTEHTKITVSTDKENSLVQMLCALYACIESDYGVFATRLFRVFTPHPVDAHATWKWRKMCCIPYYILCTLCILTTVGSVVLLYLDTYGSQPILTRLDPTHVKLALSFSSVFLGCFFIANAVSIFKIIMAVLIPHEKYLDKMISKARAPSHQVFLFAMKAEVNLMIQMVACLDSFTERQSRMVIIVDGLDTAEQEKVLEVLDAVHILFGDNKAPFIILLAIDPNVISKGMELEMKASGSEGVFDVKDYMKNIVNLPFYMKKGKPNNKGSKGRETNAKKTDGILSDTTTSKQKDKAAGLSSPSEGSQVHPTIGKEVPLTNEDNNLNMLLEGEDYFSNLTPKALRRIMNIIHITGRLLKAFDADFAWEDLSCWVNVTELWPYRLTWICIYCLVFQKRIREELSLKTIYDKIKPLIPDYHLDKNVSLDTCEKNLGLYLEEHQTSLTVLNLLTFLPYTISLDPYLRKEIVKKFRPDENFFMTSKVAEVEFSEPSFSEPGGSGRGVVSNVENEWEDNPSVTITSFRHLELVELEELCVNEVAELFFGLEGFSFNKDIFRNKIRENGISGNVLKCCNLRDLRGVLEMNFGDWEMFKIAVGILRRNRERIQ